MNLGHALLLRCYALCLLMCDVLQTSQTSLCKKFVGGEIYSLASPRFPSRENYWSQINSSTFLQDSLKCIKSITAMCPSEMRSPAPAWLKGLGTEYLGGGISAVSAQHTELQLLKSWSMKTIMNARRLSAAHGRLRYPQLLIIEMEISPHLTQREYWNVPLHTSRPLER